MLTEPRVGTICLSLGAASPYETPAELGDPFPTGATTHCAFYNTQAELLADVDGTVYADKVQYLFMPADVDTIPRGANFEIFVVSSDGTPYKIKYGKVVRRQATFEYGAGGTLMGGAGSLHMMAAKAASKPGVLFSDNPSLRVGQPGRTIYTPLWGQAAIRDNSADKRPNGLAADIAQGFSDAALRVNRSLTNDSVRWAVTMLAGGAGKTKLGVCANTGLTTYLGLELDGEANKAQVGAGSGINAMDFVGDPVDDTVADNDVYVLQYSARASVFDVFKNGDDTPLLTIADDRVPHGLGYQHLALMWNASPLSTGPQVMSWEVQSFDG